MHIAIWIITTLLVGLWSLLAYGVHTLLGLSAGLAGMPANWLELIEKIPGTAWLEIWMPWWREALVFAVQSFGEVLGWFGASAAPVMVGLVWVLWGLGVAGLVLCAALLSGLVALARRVAPRVPPAPPVQPQG